MWCWVFGENGFYFVVEDYFGVLKGEVEWFDCCVVGCEEYVLLRMVEDGKGEDFVEVFGVGFVLFFVGMYDCFRVVLCFEVMIVVD